MERAKTVPRQVKGPGVPIRAVSSSVIMALVPAYTGYHVYYMSQHKPYNQVKKDSVAHLHEKRVFFSSPGT